MYYNSYFFYQIVFSVKFWNLMVLHLSYEKRIGDSYVQPRGPLGSRDGNSRDSGYFLKKLYSPAYQVKFNPAAKGPTSATSAFH